MHHPVHKQLKAAYSFYNVSEKTPLIDLMQDALILAKQVRCPCSGNRFLNLRLQGASYKMTILVLSSEWIKVNLPPWKIWKAGVSSVSPLSFPLATGKRSKRQLCYLSAITLMQFRVPFRPIFNLVPRVLFFPSLSRPRGLEGRTLLTKLAFLSQLLKWHSKTAKIINIKIVSIRNSNENSLVWSHISTIYGFIIDSRNDQLPVGLIAELVVHHKCYYLY